MKKTFQRVVFATAICGFLGLEAMSRVTPTIVPRSQSRDKTRQLVGTVGHIDLYDMESWYGMGSIMVEYTQTFKPRQLARCLFGDDIVTGTFCNPAAVQTTTPVGCSSSSNGCNTSNNCNNSCIVIQGSQVANRAATAWLADYFYLPVDFQSTISFKPKIQNINVDLGLYVGLDEWWCGGYFWIYGPVTNTRWNLKFCETVTNAGTMSSPAGYFAPSCLSNNLLLHSFEQYAAGGTITGCSDGVIFQPLQFAKIARCKKTKTGFADLRMELGWNFLNDEDYHLGVNIQAAAPTGTERKAEWVFDAVVGNGKHWELGGGFRGHYTFWRSEDEQKSFGFYADANITHIFKAKEERTFDLKGKPNSRYMLAEQLTRGITSGLGGNPTTSLVTPPTPATPAAQFAGVYTPVANLTTFNIKTKVNVQADIVAWFNFEACGFSWDLGYNFWGRGCEKFDCPSDCSSGCLTSNLCNTQELWALKGDARTYGFVGTAIGGLPSNTPVALSATESLATIHGGTNATAAKTGADPFYNNNFGVDNAQFAIAGNNPTTPPNPVARLQITPFLPDSPSNQVKTSVDPIVLNCNDVDFCQGTRGISHKIFTHLSYTWDRECWIPYVGIGGFAEFGKHHGGHNDSGSSSCNVTTTGTTTSANCSSSNNSRCVDCALSQWGVWIKGGLSFN